MDETVKCKHNLAARIWRSGTDSNPGREFYKCPKLPSDPERCDFFAWVHPDEPAPSSSQGRNNGLPPTPQSGKTSRPHAQPESPSTPTPPQSLKRNFSAVEGSDHSEEIPRTALKRGRLEAIQEALAEVQHASSSKAQAFPHAQAHGSQPGPSSPSNRDVNPALQDPFSEAVRGGTWPPQTPSRSHNMGNTGRSVTTPSPSPMAVNGSRQMLTPSNADTESSSQVTLSDDEGLTSESIAKMVKHLQGLPEYVRKLERKKLAAEKSRDAKDSKIAYLQMEVSRLRAREKELEEVIAAYEGK